MGKPEEIIGAAADYGNLWLNGFQKRHTAGPTAAMVRNKKHLTAEIGGMVIK